jgi:uncharacterized membrane protein YfcA
MTDVLPYLIIAAGVFLGAIVQGLAGFAFSAVAGALLLHVRPPTEAVPLMMVCSVIVQLATLAMLRRTMQWRGSAALIGGGAIGLLPALYLLHHVNTFSFRIGFGLFIAGYAAYMSLRCSGYQIATFAGMRGLLRPEPIAAPALRADSLRLSPPPAPAALDSVVPRLRKWSDTALGFASGLVGGLTAMPGALPTIWCDLRGLPKDQQRGLVQPFIATMQCIALLLLLSHRDIPVRVMTDMLITLPALALGSAVGTMLFMRVDDLLFKRVVLATLFVAGLALAI